MGLVSGAGRPEESEAAFGEDFVVEFWVTKAVESPQPGIAWPGWRGARASRVSGRASEAEELGNELHSDTIHAPLYAGLYSTVFPRLRGFVDFVALDESRGVMSLGSGWKVNDPKLFQSPEGMGYYKRIKLLRFATQID